MSYTVVSDNDRADFDPDGIRLRVEAELALVQETLFDSPVFGSGSGSDIQIYEDDMSGWPGYAAGYKYAADILVDKYADLKNIGALRLVYPIMFLYRQYLELALKDLLTTGSQLVDKDKPDLKQYRHDLPKLWSDVRPLLEKFWGDEEARGKHDAIEERIAEFHKVDAGSFVFRYPEDGKGQNHGIDAFRIALQRVKGTVHTISILLDSAGELMREWLQEKWDAEWEASQP